MDMGRQIHLGDAILVSSVSTCSQCAEGLIALLLHPMAPPLYTQPFHYQPQVSLSYAMLVKTQPRVTMLVAATRKTVTQHFRLIPSALRDPRCKKDPNFPLLLTCGTERLVQVSLRKNSEKTATMLLQRRHSTFQFEGYQPYQKPYCAIGICFVVRQLDTTVQIR
jgi:hypothetical protein